MYKAGITIAVLLVKCYDKKAKSELFLYNI